MGNATRKARHSKGEFAVVAKERFPKLIDEIHSLEPHLPTAHSKYQITFCKKLKESEKFEFQNFVTNFFKIDFNWNHSEHANWYNTSSPYPVEPGKSKSEYTLLLLTIFQIT